MKFSEFEAADRRLAMLRGLGAANGYRAAATLLRKYCESVGHRTSAERFDVDLAWLAEQDLVNVTEELGARVVTLRTRGLDVANGAATVPGVSRPEPGLPQL